MRIIHSVAVGAVLSIASACGGTLPTGPSGSSLGSGLRIVCNTSTVIAGDLVVCRATDGSMEVTAAATWTSSDSTIVTSEQIGIFVAKSEGEATLTATYSSQKASTALAVHLQDVLRATAAGYQGTFKVGTAATLWLQGFYGVASAASGILRLVVTDQSGATVSSSAPLVVSHGGDRYLISTTFTLQPGTTRVCRMGVLQIGWTTVTAVPDDSLVPCFTVTP